MTGSQGKKGTADPPRTAAIRIGAKIHLEISIQARLQGRELADLAEELLEWALENKPGMVRWKVVEESETKRKK